MINEKLFTQATGRIFSEYYQEYLPRLTYFLSSYSKDVQKAEDLAQETFIQCLEEIEKYNPAESKFSTWMYTVGKNIALQRIKKEERLPSCSMDQEYGEGFKLSDTLSYDEGYEDIEQYRVVQKKARIMEEEISRLPEKYRIVITMRELEKMPYEAISKTVNLNLNTVKSQIKQGRNLLVKNVKSRYEAIDEQGLY